MLTTKRGRSAVHTEWLRVCRECVVNAMCLQVYLETLSALQDRLPPFPTEIAYAVSGNAARAPTRMGHAHAHACVRPASARLVH